MPGRGSRRETGLAVTTDFHTPGAGRAASPPVVDLLQVPAFLSRQTDMLVAAGADRTRGERQEGAVPRARGTWRTPSAKVRRRGQRQRHGHRARRDVRLQQPRRRLPLAPAHAGARRSRLLRRDALGAAARAARATPREASASSSPPLARAAVAVGVDALFFEVHDDPDARAVRRPEPDPARRVPRAAGRHPRHRPMRRARG